MEINNDINWLWWPSGLSRHVSNSSRDRGLGPRFELSAKQPHVFTYVSTIQNYYFDGFIDLILMSLSENFSDESNHVDD